MERDVGDSIWPGHLQCLDPQLLGCPVGTTKALCVPESGGLQQGGTVQARLGVAVQYHPARRRASKCDAPQTDVKEPRSVGRKKSSLILASVSSIP